MSLRSDIVSFGFWGYRGDIKTELQAPVVWSESLVCALWVAKGFNFFQAEN